MKKVRGEKIIAEVNARRKGRRVGEQTPFCLGIGVVTDGAEELTGEIRIRTEQLDSGVAPIVGTMTLDEAETFCIGLVESIDQAKVALRANGS